MNLAQCASEGYLNFGDPIYKFYLQLCEMIEEKNEP